MAVKKRCKDSCDHGSDAKFHGSAGGYNYHACRCESCVKVNSETQRRTCAPGCIHADDSPWHGGRTGYRYHKCRCNRCTTGYSASRVGQANHCADYCIHNGTEAWHGSHSGYTWHSCRCEFCTTASSDKSLIRHNETREWIKASKAFPCTDCRVEYPSYVMDYDHRDPSTKNFELAQPGGRSLDLVKQEIAKCDLVCSNCHSIRTWPKVKDISKLSARRKLIANGKNRPCMNCKISYPLCVMHYDHIDPSSKLFNVSQSTGRSLEEIKIEMAKCHILCANCHRIKTHGKSNQ